MDDRRVKLEQEYSPSLDPALIVAILSDFDLNNEDQVEQAKSTLEALKSSALAEEATGFDASGSSGGVIPDGNNNLVENATSGQEGNQTFSDDTSISNGLASLSISSGSKDTTESSIVPASDVEGIENLDLPTKEAMLLEMFPTVSLNDISFTMKKCNGNWNRAMEELMNRVWFNEAESLGEGAEYNIRAKGIDAFADNDFLGMRSRKGKQRKKFRKFEASIETLSPPSEAEGSRSPRNIWQEARTDIDFISERVRVSRATVSSKYHENGATIAAAIAALLPADNVTVENVPPVDAIINANATDLVKDFPNLSAEQSRGLIRLTSPSTAAAHELAKRLVRNTVMHAAGGLKVIPQYTRFAQETQSEPTPESTWEPGLLHNQATALAASASIARTNAFQNAQRAHRLGRSDPNMRAASSYYSMLGHDLSAQHSSYTAAAADALVASQSPRPNEEIDLHGVSVKDAVRIAEAGAMKWWDVLGEEKAVRGVGKELVGLRLVTGIGRHSEGGKAKVGPAVGRALVKQGWKVEMGNGIITIKGRTRR
ncbi:MAG: hypothetical protein M1820_001464 [Bogoriella megaspora]|nr:MAG: hypothetical protein M1820_001464 [Bogoriella megaspora]